MKTNVTMTKTLAVLAAAALVVVGAACGDDDVYLTDSGDGTPPPVTPGPSGTPDGNPGVVPTEGRTILLPEEVLQSPPLVREPPTTLPPDAPLLGEVRLRGDNAGDISAFGLEVASVEVRANGVVVSQNVTPESGLDLANTSHAWLVGGFEWPAGADKVEVRVQLADTASFTNGAGTHAVDSALPPITFTASRAQVEARGHAVIHLDLAGSLVETAGGFELLPKATIRY